MPRSGIIGTYSLPPNTNNQAPNTPISSSMFNAAMGDIEQTFNDPTPVAYGGTGAATAVGAADNLSPAFVNVASGSTTNIGAATSPNVNITGTTTITAFDSVTAGTKRFVKFAGALTLTHNGTSLILPGAANIITAAGDTAVFVSEGSGNWRCLAYQRAAGVRKPGFNTFPTSGTWNKPANLAYIVVEVWGGGGGGGSGSSAGGTGGTTSFGSHCSATGGQGGTSGAVGGRGGIGAGGDFNLRGTDGGNIDANRYGGAGGSAPRGGGGGAVAAGNEPGGGGGTGVASSGMGGGGGYAIKTISAASLSSTETVTVGAGGSAGGASAYAGAIGYVNVTEYYQ